MNAQTNGEVVCRGGGNVRGRLHWIDYPYQIVNLKPGEIMACQMTGPDWLPAFDKVAAIVTMDGGRSCHAAIVARQMNLPCVVGVKSFNGLLNQEVLIDMDTGRITEIDTETPEGRRATYETALAAGRAAEPALDMRSRWGHFGEDI